MRGPLEFALPYPPSVNHIWRRKGAQYFISAEGKRYYAAVKAALLAAQAPLLSGLLDATFSIHPPDLRRRDVDNLSKALLDSLKKGGLLGDDSQIKRLCYEFNDHQPVKGGKVIVSIKRLERRS